MSFKRRPVLVAAAAATTLAVGAFVVNGAQADPPPKSLDIQMLALNDFHGALEPPSGSGGVLTEVDEHGEEHEIEAGGAEYLATHLEELREGYHKNNSVTVAAGDLVGGTPFLSAAFDDEPTIESLNAMGLDVASVGNHEFDYGFEELERKQDGGCHPDRGCTDPDAPFEGADFDYLGANVVDEDTRMPVLDPVSIKRFGKGARVGFIGMTLEGTANIVDRGGIEGLEFQDEVETANVYANLLGLIGVDAIVVLLHEGGIPADGAYNYDCNSPGPGDGISGPIVDIAQNLDANIDAVVTGHTHQAYDCAIPDPEGNPRLVTSGASNGRLVTEISMEYDLRAHDFVRTGIEATNRAITRDVTPDSEQTELIETYQDLVGPIANEPIGHIAEDIPQGDDRGVETPLGNLIADAQLDESSDPDGAAAEIAFMNPGGIRADLLYAAEGDEGDGVVTFGEVFTVQPFGNYLVTMDLTGEQIATLLRQQFSGANSDRHLMLQPSRGFEYAVDSQASGADKVLADTIRLDGEPLVDDQVYRVTVNSFLADGGDGFSVLAEGDNRYTGPIDLDVMRDWMAANSSPEQPLTAPAADRVEIR